MHSQLSSAIPALLLSLILKYKYFVLFPILVLEGPIITIVAGALATPSAGVFSIIPLYFFVVFADLCGDTFYYLIGRHAGKRVLDHVSKKRNVDYHLKISDYFKRYGGRTLMISKVSHGLGWPAMVFAGSVRMNYKRFMVFNFFTSLVKTAALLAIGYFYSESYKEMVSYFGSTSTALTITILIIACVYCFMFWRRSKAKKIG